MLAGVGSFVTRMDERGREPKQWRVSCEVEPAHSLQLRQTHRMEGGLTLKAGDTGGIVKS